MSVVGLISRAIAAEKLKAVRMGKRVIIRRKDIDDYLPEKYGSYFKRKEIVERQTQPLPEFLSADMVTARGQRAISRMK